MCHCIIPNVNFFAGIYVIIDRGISAPGYGRKVLYGLNAIEKRFLFQLMSTVQLPGVKGYDTQMVMHTGTCTSDVSLSTLVYLPVFNFFDQSIHVCVPQ